MAAKRKPASSKVKLLVNLDDLRQEALSMPGQSMNGLQPQDPPNTIMCP